MPVRSLLGVLFICSAIIAPWIVSDWLPNKSTASEDPRNVVSVPVLADGTRERRNFSVVETRGVSATSPTGNSTKASRSISEGVAKSFATGAKALLRGSRTETVPQSERSTVAAARHTERISREMLRFGMELGNPIFCRIFKEEQELELWLQPKGKSEFSLFRVYRICQCSGGPGPKSREGDRQAPEGFYFVTPDRMVPESRFHMGFDLGYPNLLDRSQSRTGSGAMIQGSCMSDSSYALTNGAIEEVYTIASASFKTGQSFFRVHCFPFRMDDERIDAKIGEYPVHDEFWANLKEGYDFFEVLRFPPNVTLSEEGFYQFALK